MSDPVKTFPRTCSHSWINPNDPPIARAPYSPMIGPLRREMKPDTLYRCNNCGSTLKTPARPLEIANG